MEGVIKGITTWASKPSSEADLATPWAWLPAETQITPFFLSSGLKLENGVVSPPDFEREDVLKVFPLHVDVVLKFFGSFFCQIERRSFRHPINFGAKYFPENFFGKKIHERKFERLSFFRRT